MNTITMPVLGALLDAGADALGADGNGETALAQAGYLGHDDCVALLAARGGGEARTAPASVAVETFAVTVPAGLEAGARVGLSLGGRSHTVAVPGGVRRSQGRPEDTLSVRSLASTRESLSMISTVRQRGP